MDEEGKALAWTQPLITSINTPRIKLVVTPTDGGAMKAYTGYELPDNISITMYETPDKKVEKYLDSWMFGEKGVFNRKTGKFRTREKNQVTNIYRCIRFSSLIWENEDTGTDGDPAGVKLKNPEIQKSLANAKQKQNSEHYLQPITAKQQILAQITSLAATATNQLLGNIPTMLVGRVVIPPPLIKKPLIPSASASHYTSLIERSINLHKTMSKGDEQEVESIKKFRNQEKVMSTTVYTCAIEGYEPATYDYESGGPLSYTVNLSVLNYSEPEYN